MTRRMFDINTKNVRDKPANEWEFRYRAAAERISRLR